MATDPGRRVLAASEDVQAVAAIKVEAKAGAKADVKAVATEAKKLGSKLKKLF